MDSVHWVSPDVMEQLGWIAKHVWPCLCICNYEGFILWFYRCLQSHYGCFTDSNVVHSGKLMKKTYNACVLRNAGIPQSWRGLQKCPMLPVLVYSVPTFCLLYCFKKQGLPECVTVCAWASTSDCKVLLFAIEEQSRVFQNEAEFQWLSSSNMDQYCLCDIILGESAVRSKRGLACLLIWCDVRQDITIAGAGSPGILWEHALAVKSGAAWRFKSANRFQPA